MSLEKSVKMLVNDIKATREYKILKQAVLDLDKYKEVKTQLDSLQKKQMQLYKSKRSQKELESEMQVLSNEYKKLSTRPEVMRMLKAGEEFNKLMGTIYLSMGKLLDSDF